MAKKKINSILLKLEKRLRKRLEKDLKIIWKKISDKFLEETKNFEKKWIDNIFKEIWNLFKPVVSYIISTSWKSIEVWQNEMKNKFKINISFDLIDQDAKRYLKNIQNLHLSEKKWSITQYTKEVIFNIIRDWLQEWLTPQEIATNILWQVDNWVFSPQRAELIAIRELWNAFEFWKRQPMNEINKRWIWKVQKFWQTVEDYKVTHTHRQNQSDWRIDFNWRFSWTWDKMAPWSDNPRCRCTTLYNIED